MSSSSPDQQERRRDQTHRHRCPQAGAACGTGADAERAAAQLLGTEGKINNKEDHPQVRVLLEEKNTAPDSHDG